MTCKVPEELLGRLCLSPHPLQIRDFQMETSQHIPGDLWKKIHLFYPRPLLETILILLL